MNARADVLAQRVRLPTPHGAFALEALPGGPSPEFPHLILSRRIDPRATPLVRIHSECLTGDVFGSRRCDCGPQLSKAMGLLGAAPHAYLFYLRQEGRGIGLTAKLAAYALQEQGADTVQANLMLSLPADARAYGFVGEYLAAQGLCAIRLLTNNPEKCQQVAACGIAVERVPLEAGQNPDNADYLRVKRTFFNHQLEVTYHASDHPA